MALFQVTVAEFGPELVQARSASAARYDRFLSFREAFDVTFRDFLRIVKVQSFTPPPPPPRHPAMSDDKRELARHALGLPNRQFRSYRNRFVTERAGAHGAAWEAMVEAGLAARWDGANLPFGGATFYWLTHEGARSALEPGETLCSTDFPAEKAAAHG